ncbi:hypothetical protein NDU88_005390 [Pleurodeles waltl]|uniref:Uncharacterized protein n=1 Tax=Pleurodeles waltl TaxID=8319 RepID=A0AAV7TUN7_PLEWA|nr:hypothetical protein NDU88_005390 [Pleurodeles waltl]
MSRNSGETAGSIPCAYKAQRQQAAYKKECLKRQHKKKPTHHGLQEKQRKTQSKRWHGEAADPGGTEGDSESGLGSEALGSP